MDQWHWSTLASNSKVSGDHNWGKALQISVGSSRSPSSWVLAHQTAHQLQSMLLLKSRMKFQNMYNEITLDSLPPHLAHLIHNVLLQELEP